MGLDIFHVVPTRKEDAPDALSYFTLDEFAEAPEFLKRFQHLITELSYECMESFLVLFYAEKGYQRKRMNSRFWHDFKNDKLYFDLRSVIKAMNYLEPWPDESLAELQKSFKENFIDNFVEGESIFFASW